MPLTLQWKSFLNPLFNYICTVYVNVTTASCRLPLVVCGLQVCVCSFELKKLLAQSKRKYLHS